MYPYYNCIVAVLLISIILFIILFIIQVITRKNDISKLKNQLTKSMNTVSKLKNQLTKSVYTISKLKNQLNELDVTVATQTNEYKEKETEYINRIKILENIIDQFKSNLTAFPYMAGMIADIETYGLERIANVLDWGCDQRRLKKVKSIREIRKDAIAIVEKNKEAQYQLAYLLELYPNLIDYIECDFKQLPIVKVEELSEYDAVRDYLTRDEYLSLSTAQKNQLALDRYKSSHNKTKWQIGRDYELYVGYRYALKGYDIDYFGSYMKIEDLGRDIIARKDGKVLIIQCKYWSSNKLIHEKHITQLYGTVASYCVENSIASANVSGLLVTNIKLSDIAKKMANFLKVSYIEDFESGDYPCIKCNIGHDEYGETKIYHLPFDQMYDSTKIKNKGEFYAMTVAEAEAAGFRRAFRWLGNN